MIRHLATLVLVALAATCTHASGVPASEISIRVVSAKRTGDEGGRHARTDAEVHGRLALLRLDLECVDAEPRAVRRAFARVLGLNLIDHFPRKLESTIRVEASLREVPAIDVLETILGFSFSAGGPTWQVREGILEVGPRQVLALRTTPLTRVIDVSDLLLEAPSFAGPATFSPGLESSAAGSESTTVRKTPREVGAELVRSVVDGVEPDAWTSVTEEDRRQGLVDSVDPRDPFRGRNLDPRRVHPETGSPAPIFVKGRWATIRLQGNRLVVRGPAFVLRGICGLPAPVPPPRSLISR